MATCAIEQISDGSDNCYIVSCGENALLVDTCKTKARDVVLDACCGKNLRGIVLTHGHFDHCQNAAFLSTKLNIPIFMGKEDFDLARDNTRQSMRSCTFLGKVLQFKSQGEFKRERIEPFAVEGFLTDGDSLETLGIPVRIVGLPGHTFGGIGIDAGGAGLIVGDALINVPNARKAMIFADRDLMEESAEKIKRFGSTTLWYGHGKPTCNWLYDKGAQ